MNEQKRIPIFYACDDNFVKYTVVSLQSMMDNAAANRTFEIHVLHTDISQEMQQMMYNMQNEQFVIKFDDVTDYLKSISDKLPLRDYYSKTTYYRFFIAEMFPEYDKAVYIDSDTVVLGDMAKLYDMDLGDNYVGACRDQAMVQEDIFGTYAEQVIGIDRNDFFNAGMLVINCEQFRKNHVLDQFVELLHMYNFVVTQDEDYLNLICHNKVFWLPPVWNVQVFGELVCDTKDIAILHYIMVSKPWHYPDCRMREYFWEYAQKTPVYEEIQAELAAYTDEERAEDAASADRLKEIAVSETNKENNYLNLVKAGRLKSRERLEVLDKIARLEREGRFDEDVEEDPPTRELKPREIDYLRRKVSSRIKTRLTYKVARSFLNRILENRQLIIKDVKGIEYMDALESGAVITCNHFNAFDSFAIQIAYERSRQCKKRRLYRVIREGNYTNFPGFYGMLMRNCYTFPLSSNKDTMKKFMSSMDAVLRHGDFMVIYPEQSMWWNYRKPKPLKKGAYTFAVRNHVPVLPCFITMEDSDILGDDGFYVQEYTIHIAPPIYPDPDKSRAENIAIMKDKNYQIWKEIYETTYGEPLVYDCEDRMTSA
jgi:lipopolysaccharide biosynthesis glycosyltransferase